MIDWPELDLPPINLWNVPKRYFQEDIDNFIATERGLAMAKAYGEKFEVDDKVDEKRFKLTAYLWLGKLYVADFEEG